MKFKEEENLVLGLAIIFDLFFIVGGYLLMDLNSAHVQGREDYFAEFVRITFAIPIIFMFLIISRIAIIYLRKKNDLEEKDEKK